MRTFRLGFVLAFLALAAPLRGAEQNLVKWRPVGAGEAEAKKSGRPVLYFMTADWCGPCRLMKKEIFADPKLAELINKTYVPIEIVDRQREEGRNSEEADRVLRTYQCRGFPTLTIARPGAHDAFQAAGWAGKAATAEYLRIGKGRLEEMEKARREKETTR